MTTILIIYFVGMAATAWNIYHTRTDRGMELMSAFPLRFAAVVGFVLLTWPLALVAAAALKQEKR